LELRKAKYKILTGIKILGKLVVDSNNNGNEKLESEKDITMATGMGSIYMARTCEVTASRMYIACAFQKLRTYFAKVKNIKPSRIRRAIWRFHFGVKVDLALLLR
jgi:hypothetical protein